MNSTKTDLNTEADIKLMVDSFYAKVQQDALLSSIFQDFAKVDWDAHLPRMYRFWNSLILGSRTYKGNPFAAHIPLPVDETHFERWLQLFDKNIDELFEGEIATHTKLRAKSIAHIFQSKLAFIKPKPTSN